MFKNHLKFLLFKGVLKPRQHQKSAEAKTITITVRAIRRGRSSPVVLACGDEERVVGEKVITGVELITVGSCILPHCGCVPLTSVFGLREELDVFVVPELVPVLSEPVLRPLVLVEVGVGGGIVGVAEGVGWREVLLASMVGVVLISRLEAPSVVRA